MGHQFWVTVWTSSSLQAEEHKDSAALSSVPSEDQKQHIEFLQDTANALG